MKILGYGEDSLTLWALKHEMPYILESLGENASLNDCLIFYRPSFGRRGGGGRAEFGEFDFILATNEAVFLGESKWDNSSEKKELTLYLRSEQLQRHHLFKWYLTNWLKHKPSSWVHFLELVQNDFIDDFGVSIKSPKKIAPARSILSGTLQSVLSSIQSHIKTSDSVNIRNVLLYLFNGNKTLPPNKINGDFQIVSLDYSGFLTNGNLIELYD